VEAYASSTTQAHLSELDDTFVAQALRLLGSPATIPRTGSALDIGTGPGQIVLKLARHLPGWQLIGVDRSPNMIREARAGRPLIDGNSGSCAKVDFLLADGGRLPFGDASFDLVLCNSVLHHMEKPTLLFAEIARVSRPGSAILVCDLRRPSRLAYPLHVRWHGRHYSGLMFKLYCDSVHAAYTPNELSAMLCSSPLSGVQVFTSGRTHLGAERRAQTFSMNSTK
jgi:ubiquinone/menaquinone biosynthesis C-methylase UbiE